MGWEDWKEPFGDPNYKQPIDPPKAIYHGPQTGTGTGTGTELPEEIRRIFGTNPPKDYKRPVPPPPLPPHSYHKKPKYWQMRGTGFMTPYNRITLVVGSVVIGLTALFCKFNDSANRWSKRIGSSMTEEEAYEYEKKNELLWSLITDNAVSDFSTDLTGEHYHNTRRDDDGLRWDIREVDKRVMNIRDMANPMDDPL